MNDVISYMWQQHLTTDNVKLEHALAEILGFLWCEWYQAQEGSPHDIYLVGELDRLDRIKEAL